jgi:drug/metabolite transporter (DMT)-like permease
VALDRHRPSLTEWAWALVLVAALAAFLLASHPTTGNAPSDTDRLAAITAIGSAVAAVAVAVAARLPATWKATMLGAAGGIAYGLTAALLKDDLHLTAGAHPVQVFTTWPLYLLLGTGATALLVVQAAYQAGPLAASLPPLTMLNPIIAIIVGILAFHEQLSATPAAVGIEIASFAVMTAAITQLARHSDSPHPGSVNLTALSQIRW